jgi:Zn-dependent peptidase ImmA (M78 family)/transcriptional regulator with XRE-family HTH domain
MGVHVKGTGTFQGLRDLRERLLGVRLEAAAAASIDVARLTRIEAGEEPSVLELERLADTYGLDADLLFDETIVLRHGDAVAALASQAEFRDLGHVIRLRVVQAANAARDVVQLRKRLGEPATALPRLTPPNPQSTPYRQGADLAHELRRLLGLGVEPIPSMRDLLAEKLPALAVLAADLGGGNLAGLAFADATRGPAIALNVRGRNENVGVRRFSLAHELCHLLADWDRTEPLASISGFLKPDALEREQRANGFAARFLCPESVVHRLRDARDEDALRILMDEYGLHYGAARLYLFNEANIHLPEQAPNHLPDPALEQREQLRAVDDFPLAAVALERRGILAELAARAWSRGLMHRDVFAGYLGVTAGAALERVAGYFDLDPPLEDALAS